MGERDNLAGLIFLGAALILALGIAAWCTHDWMGAAPGPELASASVTTATGVTTWPATEEVRIVWTGSPDAGAALRTQ